MTTRARVGRGDRRGAAVGARDRVDDRQAEAGAAAAARRRPDAAKRSNARSGEAGREARAVVADRDPHAAAAVLGAQLDRRRRRGAARCRRRFVERLHQPLRGRP